MARTRKFKNYQEFEGVPEQNLFTSRCKLCWRQKAAESSSSSSGAEEELQVELKPEALQNAQNVSDTESHELWAEDGEVALSKR